MVHKTDGARVEIVVCFHPLWKSSRVVWKMENTCIRVEIIVEMKGLLGMSL